MTNETVQDNGSVFLSYSRTDKKIADQLRGKIEKAGFQVFQDISDTLPGEEWWERLQELVYQSDHVVFLLTKNSVVSAVCKKEIEYALGLNKQVFPVEAGGIDWDLVPSGLSKRHSIKILNNFNENDESAISDLIFSLSIDLQWIREHTRLLNRARFWNESGSDDELLGGAALIAAESWLERSSETMNPTALHLKYINTSRSVQARMQQEKLEESETQRTILKEEKAKVDKNFRTGLDVLSSVQQRLLTGMKDIRGITAPTVEFVCREILGAWDILLENDPDFYPSSVQMQFSLNRIEANVSLADALLNQGKLAEAEEKAREAFTLSEEFRQDEYNPFQWRTGLRKTAYILAILGDIYFRRGEYSKSIDYLYESLEARKAGLEFYSKNSEAHDFRFDLVDIYNRITVVRLASGSPEKAIEPAQLALKTYEELPEETQSLIHRAGLEIALGDALADSGNSQRAQSAFESAADTFEKLNKESPDNLFILRQKSICLERLGNYQTSLNNSSKAVELYNEALAIKMQLIEADPDNEIFKHDYSVISNKLVQAKNMSETPLIRKKNSEE